MGFHLSLTAKLVLALAIVGLALLSFFVLWFTPQSREGFRTRSNALIAESSAAMRDTAARDVEISRDVLLSVIRHSAEARARNLKDVPIEIYDNDLAAFRNAVSERDAERRVRLERNARILAEEMTQRAQRQIDERVEALAQQQRRDSEEFASDIRRSSLIVIAVTLAALLLALGFALHRYVIVPIQRLRDATQLIASGDLSAEHQSASSDEVGELSRDFGRMVEQLRASKAIQQEKIDSLETLAGGVAHEFNNLIGGIRGTASEALAEDADEDLRRESLSIIRRAADRGANITSQLRQYSRATRAERHLVDIVNVLNDAVALVSPDANARGVRFEVEGPAALEVRVDGDSIHQVFLNLLRNAAQAMPDGGVVTVLMQSLGGEFSIEVRDQGVGIPADRIGRVFDPFFTTKLSAVDSFARGSGLGLSVSHGVVKSHGGRVEVESEVGVGSTFKIVIPSAVEQDRAAADE